MKTAQRKRKTNAKPTQADLPALAAIIARRGLADVINGMAYVCYAKMFQVLETKKMALGEIRCWGDASAELSRLSERIRALETRQD